ncbi:elongator complex protein 3 [Zongyangia hominis]|uniref:Radical SAM protein n=1 Tax=Zongyangia hominis TaxID=2763677 RepID=A0A926E8H4_9FIRM|nr:radical SAM protein [Zongyangia hominis]MBC8569257.1 radical SAM protein [Zongyangia hominis]
MRHANVSIFVPHAGCPHRCSFCDQRAISGEEHAPTPQEVRRICQGALSDLGENAKTSEIAFFGGSFTAIERDYMVSLLEAAQPFVGKGGFGGIRISTRPDAVGEEMLSLLSSYGVTAIELGAQSMEDRVLLLNERGHTAADVADASRRIKARGFSLGLQMMVGLYGDTPQGAFETAKKLAALSPDAVRIYPVVVLEGTKLGELYARGIYRLPGFERVVEYCAQMLLLFEGRGIPVIRLGLHASPELEEKILAGFYHPAFRELCEGRIYYNNAAEALGRQKIFGGDVVFYVSPGSASKMAGQKRENLRKLEEQGYRVKICERAGLPLYGVEVEQMVRGEVIGCI